MIKEEIAIIIIAYCSLFTFDTTSYTSNSYKGKRNILYNLYFYCQKHF